LNDIGSEKIIAENFGGIGMFLDEQYLMKFIW
jgi:hypothetical protein